MGSWSFLSGGMLTVSFFGIDAVAIYTLRVACTRLALNKFAYAVFAK